MSRNSLVVAIVVAICVIGIAAWWTGLPSAPEPPVPVAKAAVKPAPPAPPAPKPAAEPVVAEAPAPQAPVEAEPAVPAGPKILTAETLKGTKWKGDMVDFNFLPDGRWQMGNRICAKWEVEGGRVRVYSESGEEHFFDIQGESLAFEGRKLGKLP
ncbi:MAG: hypothetical protein RBU21_13270 [FCB group bacterium]|jgi:hypothetical protein|nr:hypothetical protein [FCB group bacterium]